MGLEKEPDKKERPFFTGKAINLRFPNIVEDLPNGKQRIHKVEFITFPDWVHNVFLENNEYKIIGRDLQIGMPIFLNGQLFPIIAITEQYFHGQIDFKDHPMSHIEDLSDYPKYSFKRVLKGEEDFWVIQNLDQKTLQNDNLLSENQIDKLEIKPAKNLLKLLMKEITSKNERINTQSEEIKVLLEKIKILENG